MFRTLPGLRWTAASFKGRCAVSELIAAAEDQVWLAVEAADVICFILDGREGLTSLDESIAGKLRESGKKVLAIVNKIDDESMESQVPEFEALGFDEVIPVSAEHGYNVRGVEEAIEEQVGEVRS